MANRITTLFEFKEQGAGLKKIKTDIAEADGAFGKLKAGWKGAVAEFQNSRAAQAAAFGAAAKVAHESIQAASALEEAINGVKVAYGAAGESVLALGEDAATQFGMSERAFNDFAIRVSGFSTQVATAQGREVADVVEELTLRSTDFASAMGIDAADAATVFMSTLAGETEPIRRFGKDVSAAAVETYLLKEGLVESKGAITEADKVLGRYGLLMEQTKDTTGDFANTSESLANQQKIAAANVEDLGAALGKVLIPMASEATSALNDLIAAGEDAGFSLSKTLDLDKATRSMAAGGKGLGAVTGGLEDLRTMVGWFGGGEAKGAEDGLGGFDRAARGAASGGRELAEAAEEAAEGTKSLTERSDETREKLGELQAAADPAWTEYLAGIKQVKGELDGAPSSIEGVNEKFREQQEAVAEATEEVEELADAFADLKDEMDIRDAWDNVVEGALDFEDAVKDAEDATEKFGAESREAAAANREMESALRDRVRGIIDYVEQAENIPAEKVTDIRALLDRGLIAEAEAELAKLERDRTAILRITTRINNAPQTDFGYTPPRQTGTNNPNEGTRAGATGGIIRKRIDNVTIGESGPEVLLPLDQAPGVDPLGNMSLGGGGITMMPGAIQITAIGAATPELDRIIQKSLDNWNRRTGRSR